MGRLALRVALSVVLIAIPVQADTAIRYNITDLNTPLQFGGPTAINNHRQIVGYPSPDGPPHGFLWEDGVLTNLGFEPQDINDVGQIVDYGGQGAWFWDDGDVTVLEPLHEYGFLIPHGINDTGQVAGTSYAPGRWDEGFLWENGTITVLGTLDGGSCRATAINDSGQIVGGSRAATSTWSQPFLWDNGTMVGLGIITNGAIAQDVNDVGQVVGSGGTPDGARALLWENTQTINLGTLPGEAHSFANAINNHGQIVGSTASWRSEGPKLETSRALPWSNGQVFDLDDLLSADWHLIEATDVNDRGDIIGVGVNPQGDMTGFLLTPVPEPSTLAGLVGLAIVGLIGYWWRRRIARVPQG